MKKLRIYLDTNIIYGYFKSLVNKRKPPFMLAFIENNRELIEPVTSFFTMVEVVESLKKEKVEKQTILRFFRLFRRKYSIKTIEKVVITGDIVEWFLAGMSLKDCIQLNIAKNLNVIFITQDEKLREIGRKFYKSVLSFQGLMSSLELSPNFSH